MNLFKQKLLEWSNTFSTSVFLNSNNYGNNNYECICAVGIESCIPFTLKNSTTKLDDYIENINDWVFGYINYDLKNEIEDLNTTGKNNFHLPNLFFFQPKKIWIIHSDCIEALYLNDVYVEEDWNNINSFELKSSPKNHLVPKLNESLNKQEYLEKISTIKKHINRGDIYELNYCFEWFSNNAQVDTLHIYKKLNVISQSPMSVFFKNNNLHLMCSSPERYLKKEIMRNIT